MGIGFDVYVSVQSTEYRVGVRAVTDHWVRMVWKLEAYCFGRGETSGAGSRREALSRKHYETVAKLACRVTLEKKSPALPRLRGQRPFSLLCTHTF